MDKIILIDAKFSVNAERIGRSLAEGFNVPFLNGENNLTGSCVALNSGTFPDVTDSASVVVVRMYFFADLLFRAALYASENEVDAEQAQQVIAKTDDTFREQYLSAQHCDIGVTENYDLCINTAFCNITKSTRFAHEYVMCRILQECLSEIED